MDVRLSLQYFVPRDVPFLTRARAVPGVPHVPVLFGQSVRRFGLVEKLLVISRPQLLSFCPQLFDAAPLLKITPPGMSVVPVGIFPLGFE
jgi:hypothetical protein